MFYPPAKKETPKQQAYPALTKRKSRSNANLTEARPRRGTLNLHQNFLSLNRVYGKQKAQDRWKKLAEILPREAREKLNKEFKENIQAGKRLNFQ